MPLPPGYSDRRLTVVKPPSTFLRKSIIKSHFGKYGPIQSISIDKNNRNCTVTFQKLESAEIAKKYGGYWQKHKLEIGYAPPQLLSTTTSGSSNLDNTCDIESELNWFAEDDFASTGSDQFVKVDFTEANRSNSPKHIDKSSESHKKKELLIVEVVRESTVSNKKPVDVKQEIKSIGTDEEDDGQELLTKSATNLISRLALLEERDKLLRIRMNRDSNIRTAIIIKGLCPDMCPEKERMLRDVRGMVSSYESIDGTNMKMDHKKAVKDYVRSSADQEEPLAHELRPEPVLTMTMDYLITQIMTKIDTGEEDNLGNWYDFCWYRLRSIRKDIIQQHLCDTNTVEIVERCARFHICCFDRMWGASKTMFDDKINSETLMNCLQTLMHMYEDLRKQGITCSNEAEFKAYLILLKLNSGFLLSEYQQYPPALRLTQQVKDAVQIHTAFTNNMYSTYFNLMKKTTYLNCCLMQRFLAHLRTKSMEIIVRAHCPPNKISRLPLSYVIQTLKFDTREDCISYCESFGLALAEDSYNFIVSRSDFYFPETLVVINTPSSIVIRKRVSVAKAVVGAHGNLPVYIPHDVHSSFNDDGTLKQGALDAADQEEKLYRDIVERKLILKRGSLASTKTVLTPEKIEIIATPPPSPTATYETLETSLNEEPMLESISSDEGNDFLSDDCLEENVISEVLINEDVDTEKEQKLEYESISSISSESDSEQEAVTLHPVEVASDVVDSKPEELVVQKEVSPKPSTPSPIKQTEFTFKPPEVFSFVLPEFHFKPMPVVVQPKSPVPTEIKVHSTKKRKVSPLNSPSSPIEQEPQRKVEKYSPVIEKKVEEKFYFTKLKKIKMSEKMKKESVRKYALLWKKKVEKWRKISDKSLRDYLFYWGATSHSSIPRCGFRKRLNHKKTNGLLVLSILHTDVVDRIDPATRNVGELLSYSLAESALKFARKQGNVSERQPVFWKLVFSLPPSLDGNFTFPDKLRNWCKAAFYTNMNTRIGDVQYRINSLGIPVFMSFNVMLGSKSFEEKCSNISAAVVIRANGWESIEETQQRCEKLISVADSKFPMAVLTLGDKFESCNPLRNRCKLSYFYESLWNDTDKLVQTLLLLAENIYLQNLKVDSLGSIITVTSEKLFDTLHEDKFINDGLYTALCEPNNIIMLYNEVINKIEKEIIACYEANFYGTACEFEHYLKDAYTNIIQFPTHYNDVNFREILKEYLQKVYLPKIKWPFANSNELLACFKNYCQKIGCEKILSKLIRIINPPDSDDIENPLSQHLETIPWLRIVEDLVKEVINKELLNFKIVYRESKLNELTDSHWWMCSDIVFKSYCT